MEQSPQPPGITLAPERIFTIPGINLPVTNTLLCTWVVIVILAAFFYFGSHRKDLIPRGLQNFVEWVIELLLGQMESIVGVQRTRKFFPLVTALLLFILVSNLLGVIPGVGTIGAIDREKTANLHMGSKPVGPFLFGNAAYAITPWIRPPTSDLNLTIAMALIAIFTAQIFGFYRLGMKEHLNKYINLRALGKFNIEGFSEFLVGILSILTEIVRILSLALRLFGSIYVGSLMLGLFTLILPFISSIIFLPLVLFVALIQAFIFSLLTLIYLPKFRPN
jgi:F-type H+-transporting ATPase subunit a